MTASEFFPFTSPYTTINARCQTHLALLEWRVKRESQKNPFRVLVDARGPRAAALIRYGRAVVASGVDVIVRTDNDALAEEVECKWDRVRCFNAPVSDLVKMATPNLIILHGLPGIYQTDYQTPEVWPHIHPGTFFYHDAPLPTPAQLVALYTCKDNALYREKFRKKFGLDKDHFAFFFWLHLMLVQERYSGNPYHTMAITWRLADETGEGAVASGAQIRGAPVNLSVDWEPAASFHMLSRKEGKDPSKKLHNALACGRTKVMEGGEAPGDLPVFYDTVTSPEAQAWGAVCDVDEEEMLQRMRELDAPATRLQERVRASEALIPRDFPSGDRGMYLRHVVTLLNALLPRTRPRGLVL